ncbi:hypothetical protein ABT039_22685 [Streptomyces lasiicapitis]|uniref:hypothetical protein n=1 Tax=Streptomyces lasiicapitis TaxID=1923961 RepID=UPI00332BD580
MDGQSPGVALWPGDPARAFHIDTHVLPGADGVAQIHLTRYPAGEPTSYSPYAQRAQEHLRLHLHAQEPDPPEALARAADVVVGPAGDAPPLIALHRLRTRRTAATAVGVTLSDRSALVWLNSPGLPGAGTGYLVTMTGDEPGPVALYPSALYGWALHWLEQHPASALEELPDGGALPAPPLCVDLVEAWRPYRIRLEHAESVTWPSW